MSDRSAVHTFTKLLNEPFFIECEKNLKRDGALVATIVSITEVRIERRVQTNPEQWEVVFRSVVDGETAPQITSVQILEDATMVAGILNADRDADPPPGTGYMILAECLIQFTAELGGGTVGRAFRREARIAPSAVTAPVA